MVDVLVIGSGGAGLTAGLIAKAKGADVLIVSKNSLTASQTSMAQGGINSALGNVTKDSIELHISDTIKASYGLGSLEMIERMCKRGIDAVSWLDRLGVPFNRTKDGKIAQRALGGASSKRACYSQDYTGLKILHTLFDNILEEDIPFLEDRFLLNLIVEDKRVKGATFLNIESGEVEQIIARSVILATGGFGSLYRNHTTNAINATGDGVASILRAGGTLSNMEFIQFHPTAMKHSLILVSEGARGEGGYLVNSNKERFIDELLPRDIVARAIFNEIKSGKDVFIDVRHLGEKRLLELMPQEVMLCRVHEGVDPVKELIPIKPVSHYTMGGVDVDSSFRVDGLDGVYAVGECSNAKVHGANRLGGNSLLEIVAFGMEVGEIAVDNLKDITPPDNNQLQKDREFIDNIFKREPKENFYQLENNLGEKFYKYAGIIREKSDLKLLRDKLENINIEEFGIVDKQRASNTNLTDFLQFLNILELGRVVVESALLREESRGAHFRADFPESSDEFLGEFCFFKRDGELKYKFVKKEER